MNDCNRANRDDSGNDSDHSGLTPETGNSGLTPVTGNSGLTRAARRDNVRREMERYWLLTWTSYGTWLPGMIAGLSAISIAATAKDIASINWVPNPLQKCGA